MLLIVHCATVWLCRACRFVFVVAIAAVLLEFDAGGWNAGSRDVYQLLCLESLSRQGLS